MRIIKTLAAYNILDPSEKQWCVQMFMPDKSALSEKWPENDEPDIDGIPPSKVLDMIEERLQSYWIYTGREEKLARIAAYREQAEQLDDAWARLQIASYERMVDSLKPYLITESDAA